MDSLKSGSSKHVTMEVCVAHLILPRLIPQILLLQMMRGFFIGHRRYVKDGHWIRDAGFLIGKR